MYPWWYSMNNIINTNREKKDKSFCLYNNISYIFIKTYNSLSSSLYPSIYTEYKVYKHFHTKYKDMSNFYYFVYSLQCQTLRWMKSKISMKHFVFNLKILCRAISCLLKTIWFSGGFFPVEGHFLFGAYITIYFGALRWSSFLYVWSYFRMKSQIKWIFQLIFIFLPYVT